LTVTPSCQPIGTWPLLAPLLSYNEPEDKKEPVHVTRKWADLSRSLSFTRVASACKLRDMQATLLPGGTVHSKPVLIGVSQLLDGYLWVISPTCMLNQQGSGHSPTPCLRLTCLLQWKASSSKCHDVPLKRSLTCAIARSNHLQHSPTDHSVFSCEWAHRRLVLRGPS
jgi:hypothetical protein